MTGLNWTDDRAFTYHGGALEVARRLVPQAPEPWIDLSTGVNPHAYPLPDLAPEAWSRLPETGALAKLEAAAARRYGVAAASVVAGPGSQALIHALAHILRRGAVGALTPTYGGFAEAFAAVGARVAEAKRLKDMNGLDVAIVVNPNNPDGRIIPRGDLLALHERLARRGGVLIVDEAFADFDPFALEFTRGSPRRVSSPQSPSTGRAMPAPTRGGGCANVIDSAEMQQALDPEESLAPMLPASGAIVLRSFGKAYGLAGLRLGFALASADIVPSLRAALGSWPVSGPAIAIGMRALADSDWLEAMRARLGQGGRAARRAPARGRLANHRWNAPVSIGGASSHARAAFERLLAAGILARPFADERTWLRFGIPGDENAWERLAAALQG